MNSIKCQYQDTYSLNCDLYSCFWSYEESFILDQKIVYLSVSLTTLPEINGKLLAFVFLTIALKAQLENMVNLKVKNSFPNMNFKTYGTGNCK